ncbi:hypothetical protein LIER_20152 [Lithospermum erythrorhizon]|uniref:Uncharacterized protein n=1 Tax=Lithospermum erythrorhizon TaxID=34254 RepID=A0AAV3QN70_LITER
MADTKGRHVHKAFFLVQSHREKGSSNILDLLPTNPLREETVEKKSPWKSCWPKMGQIKDWTEEISMVEKSKAFCGEKTSRVVFDDSLSLEDPILARDGARKKLRTPGSLDVGPSNWMDRIDNEEDENWSDTEDIFMELDDANFKGEPYVVDPEVVVGSEWTKSPEQLEVLFVGEEDGAAGSRGVCAGVLEMTPELQIARSELLLDHRSIACSPELEGEEEG